MRTIKATNSIKIFADTLCDDLYTFAFRTDETLISSKEFLGNVPSPVLDQIESREMRSSTIILSQLPFENWYDLFADKTYADAIIR